MHKGGLKVTPVKTDKSNQYSVFSSISSNKAEAPPVPWRTGDTLQSLNDPELPPDPSVSWGSSSSFCCLWGLWAGSRAAGGPSPWITKGWAQPQLEDGQGTRGIKWAWPSQELKRPCFPESCRVQSQGFLWKSLEQGKAKGTLIHPAWATRSWHSHRYEMATSPHPPKNKNRPSL